jgi:hypothetical protein
VIDDGQPVEMLDVSAIQNSQNPHLRAIVSESCLLV